jgi:hypothetical protein
VLVLMTAAPAEVTVIFSMMGSMLQLAQMGTAMPTLYTRKDVTFKAGGWSC